MAMSIDEHLRELQGLTERLADKVLYELADSPNHYRELEELAGYSLFSDELEKSLIGGRFVPPEE